MSQFRSSRTFQQLMFCLTFALLAAAVDLGAARATTQFQREFLNKYIKDHEDKDFANLVKRKAKCFVCHWDKKHFFNNAYGAELAKLLDPEEDKRDKEKIANALDTVGKLPFNPADAGGETYADRIANSKLPAGELDDLIPGDPVTLFDGESLKGWVGATNGYEVRDGVIASLANAGGNLMTEKEYSNYIFSFDFRLTPGANSGLGILSPVEGDAAYQGIELQILDNSADQYANLKPYQYHGSAYGIAPAKRGELKPVGEWNTQQVQVEGRRIKVVLNGKPILNINLDEVAPDGKTVDGNEHPGLSRTKGHIGFLGHNTVVEFREISIIELKPAVTVAE